MEARKTEGGECWRIAVTNSQGGIRQVQIWLHNVLTARDVSAERIGEVELIAEEVLTNIVRENSGPGTPVGVTVECELTAREISLTFRDDGKAFDPLAHAAPDLGEDAASRSVGGLGIHLVRELASAAHYARVADRNVLDIRLVRTSASNGVSS